MRALKSVPTRVLALLVSCGLLFFASTSSYSADDEPRSVEEREEIEGGDGETVDPFGGDAAEAKPSLIKQDLVRKSTGGAGHSQRLAKVLETTTEFDFYDATLSEIVDMLSAEHDVNILIDARSIDDDGIDLLEPINLQLNDIKFRTALRVLLDRMGLDYLCAPEFLMITTRTYVEDNPETRMYDVRDLLVKQHTARSLDDLIEVIRLSVDPHNWHEQGGIGSVSQYQGILVVAAAPRTHEKLDRFLVNLRAAVKLAGGPTLTSLYAEDSTPPHASPINSAGNVRTAIPTATGGYGGQ